MVLISGAAAADAPTKLWELGWLETPESALPDSDASVIYVSNIAGKPTEKDGNGYISKVSIDGRMLEAKWVTGLDAPKGLIKSGGKVFVSDIDKLVEIDVASGKIAAKHEAPGAKFLNDTAVDGVGNVYVSDMLTNVIWRLSGGKLEPWLSADALINPNGLFVDGDQLVVAAWGVMAEDWSTKVPGHLLAVSLKDKSVKALGSGAPVGNLDGLEPLGKDSFLVSDWAAGKVFRIARSGEATELIALSSGSADLGYDAKSKTAFIPLMKDGKLVAYRIGE
jgi:hypothetical protein